MNDYDFRDPTRWANDWVDSTTLNPVSATVLFFAVLAIFMVPRRAVLVPVLISICLVGASQRVVIFGLDFQALRLLGTAAMVRFAVRGDFRVLKKDILDRLILLGAIVPVICLLFRGRFPALGANLGYGLDAVAMYYLGRVCLTDLRAVRTLALALLVLSIPIFTGFAIEKSTGRNIFSIFGGIDEITHVRQGKIRVQGAFAHSIIAGCWFASSLPILLSQWGGGNNAATGKIIAVLGGILAITCCFMTSGSTAISSLLVVLLLAFLYPFRSYISSARKLIVVLAILIHFTATNGLHHFLFARFTISAGSTGYHRYRLVDAAIDRFSEWFLFGTDSTYHWGWGLDDVTCQYVAVVVNGGIAGVAILVAIFVVAFRRIGVVMSSPKKNEVFVGYFIGVALVSHLVAFLGVSYFGQIFLLLYATLGATASLAATVVSEQSTTVRSRTPARAARLRSRETGRLDDLGPRRFI